MQRQGVWCLLYDQGFCKEELLLHKGRIGKGRSEGRSLDGHNGCRCIIEGCYGEDRKCA